MILPKAVLDSDTVSALHRNEPIVVQRASAYVATYRQWTLSIITRFEVLRGLKAKGATAQIARFEQFCRLNEILSLTDAIVVRACDIYANLRRQGQLIGDADILIAATALEHGLAVVTNNERHFRRVAGLTVLNWQQP